MKSYAINDTTLTVREQGSGTPVLFIHGYPFDHSMWNRVFDAFDKTATHCTSGETGRQSAMKEYRLIAPDLRGLGSSGPTKSVGPTDMEQFADDLHALLDTMGIMEKIVVCGLSMGGYVAMQFVMKYGADVAGIVLSNTKTGADSPQIAENRHFQAENLLEKPDFLKSVADTMIPKMFSAKTLAEKPEVVREMRVMIESNNPQGAAAATLGMARRPDTTKFLKQINVPVLVVCGSEDQFSPPNEMKPLAEIAQYGSYVEIPDTGHLPPMEQPEAFAEVLGGFIDGLS